MKKVDGKQNIKSSARELINIPISEDLKNSENVGSEVEKERQSSSEVRDSVARLDVKTDATGMVHTSETSNLCEQSHSSTVKGTDRNETVVPYECDKDCNIEKECRTLIDENGKVCDSGSAELIEENGKVCDSGSGEVLEEGATAYKAQSISREGGSILSSKSSSIDEHEHYPQRELITVVNRVTIEVNPEQNALEKEEPHCVISEAEHHSDSKPSVSNEDVSSVQQENKETNDASNESRGDFVGNSIQTSQHRNCTEVDEGTEGTALRKLSKEAEKNEHEIIKSQIVSTDFNDDGVNGYERASYPSVSCRNASVQNHTFSEDGVECKTEVTEVGKTVDQSLGESEHADGTEISGELAS
jgi:hypothetical protein